MVEPPAGEPLWVGTYHPHPARRPHKRAEDVRDFLTLLDGQRGVLCGDLNAISPEDAPDEAQLARNMLHFKTPDEARRTAAFMVEAGRALFDDVLPALGWKDAIPPPGRRISLPTALKRRPGDVGLRIDHALVSPGVAVREARVLHDPDADEASDHYPLLLDLE